jgi:hypothetical protein
MAEVGVANRQEWVAGNKRMVSADLSGVDHNDTWTTGLARIDWWNFEPTTAPATGEFGGTIVGGVVTFVCEGGGALNLSGKAMASGF